MLPADKLDQIVRRFEFLEAKLSAGAPPAEIAELSREYSDLKPVVAEIAAWRQARQWIASFTSRTTNAGFSSGTD